MRKIYTMLILLILASSCSENKKAETNNSDEVASNEVTQKTEVNQSEDNDTPKGLVLIKGSDCSACHMVEQKLVGPSYKAVAEKYKDDDQAPAQLIKNIVEGSNDVWGEIPMPGHPQLTKEDVSIMVDYILSLN